MNGHVGLGRAATAACVVLMVAGFARGVEPSVVLDQALEAYRTALDCPQREQRLQHFQRAELLFSRMVNGGETGQGGIHNADLYVNWGNAALGAEHLGVTVLAYRRALQLDPDHRRAGQNLRHVRGLLPDTIPKPESGGLFDTFFSWTGRLSQGELRSFAALTFLLCAALIAASIRWRKSLLRNLAWLPGIAWVVLTIAMLLNPTGADPNDAVVIVNDVVARAADSPHAPSRFAQPLPAGTEVSITESRDDWTRTQLADGREAWLPTSALARVSD